MRESITCYAALVAVGIIFASSSFAEPTTRWGGASSPNMVSDATNLPASIDGVEPLWEIPLGIHQYVIPTIDRGSLYIGSDDRGASRPGCSVTGGGVLMRVDQKTGKVIWQLVSPRFRGGLTPPYHFNKWKSGFCSGPVVDGDRIYIIGGRGEVLCLDRDGQANGNAGPFVDEIAYMEVADGPDAKLQPTDGDIIWQYDLIKGVDVVPHDVCGSTILLHDGLLYCCTSNGLDDKHAKMARPNSPALIALDAESGELVAVENTKISKETLHCNWSSPCFGVADGKPLVFFGGGDGWLYAFEPAKKTKRVEKLKLVWSHDCNPPDYRVRDGEPLPYWSKKHKTTEGPSDIIAAPVFHEGRVYVAIGQSPYYGPGDGRLVCVDAATGKEIWGSKLVDRSLATVAIKDDLLFVSDFSGRLHCFDVDSGERHWVHEMGAGAWQGSPFVADGKVYAGTERNMLWTLRASKTKEVLSSTRLKAAPITLAADNGVLYVPTQRSLMAFSGPK